MKKSHGEEMNFEEGIIMKKSHGEEMNFEEGMKFDSEKLRYDLLSPEALDGLVKILTFGATKYGDRNWEKGIKFSRIFGALNRHGWSWWDKKDLDDETKMNHIYHLLCNAMFLAHFISNPEKYKEFDDRPE